MKIVNRTEIINNIFSGLKWSLFFNLLLTFIIVSLCIIITLLFPLQQIKPYFVTFSDKSEQIVNIEPVELSMNGKHLMMEKLSIQYVIMRETIDLYTATERLNKLKFFHTVDMHRSFLDIMDISKPNSPLNIFKQKKVARQVQITASSYLGPSVENVWQIMWDAIDLDIDTGNIINKKSYISTLHANLIIIEAQLEDRLTNPLGFLVDQYQITPKLEK